MYEYIRNAIIEETLKAIIKTVHYIFLLSADIWSYADIYYLGEPEETEENDYQCSFTDVGETGNIGWEYEYQDVLTTLYNYLFNHSQEDNTNALQPSTTSASTNSKPPVSYPDKYRELWKKREPHFKSKEHIDAHSLKHSVLFENTPFGNVIMYYDADKTSFVYYCDKTLSYPIINSVGRKYVLTFECEGLYVDDIPTATPTPTPPQTTTPIQSNEPETQPTQPTPVTESKKNVFAKLKNYKKPTNQANKLTNTKSATTLTEDLINRYTCEGKLANFNFIQRIPKVKAFSYKDFKNKMATK